MGPLPQPSPRVRPRQGKRDQFRGIPCRADGDDNKLAAAGHVGHREAGFVCRQLHFEDRLPRLLVEGAKFLSAALRAGREQTRSIT